MNAESVAKQLNMTAHPEGGFYKETYRSNAKTATGRSMATGIYFLLSRKYPISHLHRITSDELWHHYDGLPLTVVVLDETLPEQHRLIRLGKQLERGQVPQALVPGGYWFGSFLDEEETGQADYALVGCTVTPGFEFQDFEMGKRQELVEGFPEARKIIERLT